MKLEDIDTSRCLFDPKRTDLIQATKHIKEFDVELSYRVSLRTIIRYIALMYDASSPLWREVRSLPLRKAVAMELAGAKKDRMGRFERPIEIILEGRNQDVNAMMMKYIVLQNNPDWTNFIVYQQMYYMDVAKAMSGAYKDTSKATVAIERLSSLVDKGVVRLLGGEGEAPQILDVIYKEATKDLDVSPEEISKHIENSGDVPEDWNPYNVWKENELKESYKVDEIKFVGDK